MASKTVTRSIDAAATTKHYGANVETGKQVTFTMTVIVFQSSSVQLC